MSLHTTELPMTVFAAARGYAAHAEWEWVPTGGARHGTRSPAGRRRGHLPGGHRHRARLDRETEPHRDTHDRTYLYASNIAIEEGKPQPVHFVPGEDLRLTDSDGRELLVRIIEVLGRSALVEYRPMPEEEAA